ncbi:MAG TPA: methylated-DNA--[protein]-cysteine S-methyltransferase, partial [Herpetosiphonaceae bacterium]
LGEAAGMSPFHLQRVFKRIVGVSPREYVAARRAQRFKDGLHAGEPVTAAAFDAGFGSSSTVYQPAHGLGMTPGAYGRGGAALRISYALLASPLGPLLIGATERGVCAVALGDNEAALEAELRREYPAAELARDDGGLAAWGAAVVSHLAGERTALDLPLDVRGTAFQWRVWQALRSIPAGETRSYGEVAGMIGQPAASRAVARACASNKVALAIPCHRVIQGDGGLGGYRWGTERKRALLERERSAAERD